MARDGSSQSATLTQGSTQQKACGCGGESRKPSRAKMLAAAGGFGVDLQGLEILG